MMYLYKRKRDNSGLFLNPLKKSHNSLLTSYLFFFNFSINSFLFLFCESCASMSHNLKRKFTDRKIIFFGSFKLANILLTTN